MQRSSDSAAELNTIRDTVESIWIAIVLAFVLRAFFIEAFVIPTGSMAPRLMGEHWDLRCPNCQYDYAHGYPGGGNQAPPPPRGDRTTVPSAQCPNCGFPYAKWLEGRRQQFVNAGDRVLVMKYLYTFHNPEPWDVVVFKNPQNNQENYIKRLIGLPGETLEIVHGDIFVRDPQWPLDLKGSPGWHIRRKSPKAQEAMWQVLYDNDYRPAHGLPSPRGASDTPLPVRHWAPEGQPGPWDLSGSGGRQFAYAGGKDDRSDLTFDARTEDFWPTYGYNPSTSEISQIDKDRDIVSDLKLAVTFVPKSAEAALTLQLSSFENRFVATVWASGGFSVRHSPSLEGDRWADWRPRRAPNSPAGEPLEWNKGHDIALVHADFRIQLWIDGRCVFETTDSQYRADHDALKARMENIANEPIPRPIVKLGGGGGAFDLRHVRLMRDVYYTSYNLQGQPSGPLFEYANALDIHAGQRGWGVMGNPIRLSRDSYFCLGDNSPMSLDGRGWWQAAPTLRLWKHPEWPHATRSAEENTEDALYQLGTVPKYNLIGKALFVYWPAGLRPPGLDFVPLVPNAGKMRLIR